MSGQINKMNYLPSLSQSYTSTLIVLLGGAQVEDQIKTLIDFLKISSSVYIN